jgi:polar amino acid transport system substrate-binding protein
MTRAHLALLASILMTAAACTPAGTGGSASPGGATGAPATSAAVPTIAVTPTTTETAAATTPAATTPAATETAAASPTGTAAVDPNDLLTKIRSAGTLRVSTDPNYAPQSFLRPDGTFEGFDIDVANEIGKRLGVKVQFETPNFDLVQAGGWAGRFDISVGSVTITEARQAKLDFTEPYYFTPAQVAATQASGITDLAGLAGKTVCVGEATTYFDWVQGTLKLAGDVPEPAAVPAGLKVTTLPTDANCIESVASGRTDFEAILSSSTTIAGAIKGGAKIVNVGEPVFYEALAVATDKGGPPHAALQAELDRIIGEMHADGTLTAFSQKWFEGLDLTKAQ